MAGLFGKIEKFARGPKGKEMINKAQRLAKDPATRAKLDKVRKNFGKKK